MTITSPAQTFVDRQAIRDFLDGRIQFFSLPEPQWGPIGKEVFERTYARTVDVVTNDGEVLGTRIESWADTVKRVVQGSLSYVGRDHWLEDEDVELFDLIYNFKALPAGRHLWVTGTPASTFSKNCWSAGFGARTSSHFAFLASRLLEGGGVGSNYSSDVMAATEKVRGSIRLSFRLDESHADFERVQAVAQDRLNTAETADYEFIVEDNREGWVSTWTKIIDLAVGLPGERSVIIDLSDVRPFGAELKTFGGTASGPDALVRSLLGMAEVLNNVVASSWSDRRLTGIEAMTIDHELASAIVAGGARRCMPQGTRLNTARGAVKIEDIKVGDIVQTAVGSAPVTAVFDQGFQSTIKIRHEFGVLECTPNHKVAVFDSLTTWEFKEAQHVTSADHLVWDFSGCDGNASSSLPAHDAITELHHASDYRRANGRSNDGYARHDGQCTVDGCDRGVTVLTPDPICNMHYLRKKVHGDPLTTAARRTQIKLPDLDADVAWFFGLIQGDGHVHLGENGRGAVGIACAPEYPRVIEDCEKMFARFGVDHVVIYGPKDGDRCTKIVARRVELARWMAANIKTAKATLHVPEFIWSAPRDVRAAFVAGLFDADGSWKTRPLELLVTCYEEYATEIVQLLSSLGIAAYKKPLRKADNEEGWQPTWNVAVAGQESLRIIGEWFSMYSRKFQYDGRTVQGRKGFGFDKDFGLAHGLPTYGGEKNKKYSVRVAEDLGDFTLSAWPVSVLGIEGGRQSVQTYDIEVEGIHQFTAEGLVVHNSARMAIMSWRDIEVFDFIQIKENTQSHWTTNISVEIDDDFHAALANPHYEEHAHAEAVLREIVTGMVRNGEPGMVDTDFFSRDEARDVRITNPCGEVGLNSYDVDGLIAGESCNLGSIDLDVFGTDHEGAKKAFQLMARFLYRSTLNPHRDSLANHIESTNRRIGVGIMGLQGWAAAHGVRLSELEHNATLRHLLSEFRQTTRSAADAFARELGLPLPLKVTAVAPTGSIAQLRGSQPGIHPVFARYFKRRVRYSKADLGLGALRDAGHHIEDDLYAANTSVVEFFVKDAILDRYEESLIEQSDELSADQFFGLIATVQETFCGSGDGNAVSATAQIAPNMDPEELAAAVRGRLGSAKGLTVFPSVSRPQSPYETISAADYEAAVLSGLAQAAGDSNSGECVGGACPIR